MTMPFNKLPIEKQVFHSAKEAKKAHAFHKGRFYAYILVTFGKKGKKNQSITYFNLKDRNRVKSLLEQALKRIC